MKQKKKGYGILLGAAVVCTLAALSTVIPQTSAEKECLFGYKAHCSFTPISTILCIVIASFICVLRKKKFTDEA